MIRRSRRSGSVPFGILNGDCMLVAECGALLPRNAAVNISSPQRNHTVQSPPTGGCDFARHIQHVVAVDLVPQYGDVASSK